MQACASCRSLGWMFQHKPTRFHARRLHSRSDPAMSHQSDGFSDSLSGCEFKAVVVQIPTYSPR